jgi:chemotaxis protein methyltransferase CheR
LREKVVPLLRTYPSLKVWVAGCSTGEEVYSLAILLREEDLLAAHAHLCDRHQSAVAAKAAAGVYAADRIAGFTENHRNSGCPRIAFRLLHRRLRRAVFDKSFRRHIVFSDHSLATDSVFAEVQLISCRNVLIYFNRAAGSRVGLFRDALCRKGFLGIGMKESLRFSSHAQSFVDLAREDRIFQKRSEP